MRKLHSSGLSKVRDAANLNQQKLADLLGTTKAVVENTEMGRTKLTPAIVEKIVALTGVDPATLETNNPLDFQGQPYSADSWARWAKLEFSPRLHRLLLQKATGYLSDVLNTSAEKPDGTPTPHLFRTFLLEFNQWLFEKIDQHNLTDRLEIHSERNPYYQFQQTTTVGGIVAELSQPGGENWLNQWRKKADPDWPSDTPVEILKNWHLVHLPFVGFRNSNGQQSWVDGLETTRHVWHVKVGGRTFTLTGATLEQFGTKSVENSQDYPPQATPPPSAQPSPSSPPSASPPKTAPRPKASPAPGKPKK